MVKRLLALMLVFSMVFAMAACGVQESSEPAAEPEAPAQQEETSEEHVEGMQIYQYFAASEYVYDGTGSEMMAPVSADIDAQEGDAAYMASVASLKTLPEGEGYYTAINDQTMCKSITVSDGVAYVDFAEGQIQVGPVEELLIVDQIVYTLANSFDEIAAVKFTIDGKDADVLYDAVDIAEPIVADYL